MEFISSIINASNTNYTKKNNFKDLQCKPRNITSKKLRRKRNTKKNNDSCLDTKTIKMLKNIWNLRHPDVQITTNNKKRIMDKLKSYMNKKCENEICIVKSLLNDENKINKIKNEFYVPQAPSSWHKNINEWLSSLDIESVMKQYEDIYDEFIFLGPSPIDFETKRTNSICVWPEICNINIEDLKQSGKTKIGFIFNTDPHYKSGSHWIAMYLDIEKKILFFFDSNGDTIPNELNELKIKLIEQCKKINIKIKFMSNEGTRHQNSNTECGMYCLYFIISLLTGKHNFKYFKTRKIKDKEVEKLRKVYFNLI